jgi:hypothetical protein
MAFVRPVMHVDETILARCRQCGERVATHDTYEDLKTGQVHSAGWHFDRQCEHDVQMPSEEKIARHVARYYREKRRGPLSAVRCYV